MKKLCTSLLVLTLCLSLVACSVDEVLSGIDVALQTAASLESAVGAVSPADAAILESLTGLATVGLNAIKKDYDAYEASKASGDLQKVQAAVSALQTNLAQNLQAAHISSPSAVAKTTAWVNLVNSSLAAVNAAVGAASPAQGQARASVKAASLPTAASLQARWQSEVCAGDGKCGKLVKVHHKHAHTGFWRAFGDGLGNAIGEAKFGQ